jgi:hypothetical protein
LYYLQSDFSWSIGETAKTWMEHEEYLTTPVGVERGKAHDR